MAQDGEESYCLSSVRSLRDALVGTQKLISLENLLTLNNIIIATVHDQLEHLKLSWIPFLKEISRPCLDW